MLIDKDREWPEEEQRAVVVGLAQALGDREGEVTARRCCYPGVLRYMRNHIPLEQQVELLGRFVPHPELADLLARLNCWLPRRDAPLPAGVREVPLFEAASTWRGRPLAPPRPGGTLGGAVHLMVTAMTRGRRTLVRGWAQGAVLDAENVFKAAADELLSGAPGPALRAANLLLEGWWPVGEDPDGTVVAARVAG